MKGNLTWRDETGQIMTRATKAQLAERLYRLERYLWLNRCCELEKYHVSMTIRLMNTSHVARDSSMSDFWKDELARKIEQYRIARQKRDSMLAALTRDEDE